MDKNSESIYGCGLAEFNKPDWGRYTRKGDVLYAHWMYPAIGHINVKGIADKTPRAYLLSTGAELPSEKGWWGNNEKDNYFVNVNRPTYMTFTLPDQTNTVIKIILK
jgi:alpha-L-fucosidase